MEYNHYIRSLERNKKVQNVSPNLILKSGSVSSKSLVASPNINISKFDRSGESQTGPLTDRKVTLQDSGNVMKIQDSLTVQTDTEKG